MISLINAFKSNPSLSFSLSSSTTYSSYEAERALNKEGDYFCAKYSADPNTYWQISFSQPVSIGSYIISGPQDWGYWQTSWEISYALDDSSFITKQTDEIDDLRGNTKKFPINPPIYCKHFKITGKTHTNPSCLTALGFYCFDCFGSVKVNEENTLCRNYVMNHFLENLLNSLMIPFSQS